MTRTRKNFRQNSLVGGSNNAGPADELNNSSFNNLRENLEGMHLESPIDSFLAQLGCIEGDDVNKTKCLFDFMLKNEGGILPVILFMIRTANLIGKTDFKTYLKTFINVKNPAVSLIHRQVSQLEKEGIDLDTQQKQFMDEVTRKVIDKVNYELPKNSKIMLLNIQEILFSRNIAEKQSRLDFKNLMKSASFKKTMEEKTYMSPIFSHVLAKKFFENLNKINVKTLTSPKKKINAIAEALELTLREIFQCRSRTEPQVDALLHELQGEVAVLQMQESAEQAQLRTFHERLEAVKTHIAETEEREKREADERVAQLQTRLDKHKRGEAGTKRKGSRAEGMKKTSIKKKRTSSKGSSKKKKGEKGSVKKKPTKKKGGKKKK